MMTQEHTDENKPVHSNYTEDSQNRAERLRLVGEYKDAVEYMTLQRLLPPTGRRLIEIDAGSGRLANLYAGYDEVVLFDQSPAQLREAQDWLSLYGLDQWTRYTYCVGDYSNLPFVPGLFDTAVVVCTVACVIDVPTVLHGVAQILATGGTLVLAYANKRSLAAIQRYLLRRQDWSPFEWEPVMVADHGFKFHPAWMRDSLGKAGLQEKEVRTVSHLRFGFLKRAVPVWLLMELGRPCSFTGKLWHLASSVFVRCELTVDQPVAAPDSFFRCPLCSSTNLTEEGGALLCIDCRARFGIHDGIHDFRTPQG